MDKFLYVGSQVISGPVTNLKGALVELIVTNHVFCMLTVFLGEAIEANQTVFLIALLKHTDSEGLFFLMEIA